MTRQHREVFKNMCGILIEKVVSNIEKVRSRDGQVIAFTTDGDGKLEGKADYLYRAPDTVPCLTPMLVVLPLQLLACRVALLRRNDVAGMGMTT